MGIKKLFAACIVLAVKDAKKKNISNRDREDAIRWMMSPDEGAVSFIGMCETLGVDARKIRDAGIKPTERR